MKHRSWFAFPLLIAAATAGCTLGVDFPEVECGATAVAASIALDIAGGETILAVRASANLVHVATSQRWLVVDTNLPGVAGQIAYGDTYREGQASFALTTEGAVHTLLYGTSPGPESRDWQAETPAGVTLGIGNVYHYGRWNTL